MEFQHKLLDKDGKTVKDIAKAMWLLAGTNLKVEPRIIGNRNKRISDVELRAFMDTVVYERYKHQLTTPTRHIYSWVDVVEGAENAGAEEVDELDENGDPTGFKTYLQVSIDSGVKSLSKFQADPDFKSGPGLRIKKHARIKILLEDIAQGDFCHKIYIAHIRKYIEDGLFIGQMLLAQQGNVEDAYQIRCDKIAARTGTRKTAYLINQEKDNGNWAQVEEQLAEIEGVEPVEVPEGEELPEGNGDERTLIFKEYNSGGEVNMFDLEAKRYGVRRNKTPGFWDWDPNREGSIEEWIIMRNSGYTIDFELGQ